MAAAQVAGAAMRVRKRLGHVVGGPAKVLAKRRAAPGIDGRSLVYRRTLQHIHAACAQFRQLIRTDHAFEDVVAVTPIGGDDVRMHLAAGVKTNRAFVADCGRPPDSAFLVGLHARRMFRAAERLARRRLR